MPDRQHRGASQRQDQKGDGSPQWQGRRRDHHRSQKQNRKRIDDAARQKEKGGELENVEPQNIGRPDVVETLADRKPPTQRKIEQRGHANAKEAPEDRQIEAEPEPGDQNRRRLARDRQPTQSNKRIDAQLARALAKIVVEEAGHRRSLSWAVPGGGRLFHLVAGIDAPEIGLPDVSLEPIAVDIAPETVTASDIDDDARF